MEVKSVQATAVWNTCPKEMMWLPEMLVPEWECERATEEANLMLTVDRASRGK